MQLLRRNTYELSHGTDPGRVRKNNEDSYVLFELRARGLETALIIVVADGVGGQRAGEYASRLAIKTIRREMERHADLFNLHGNMVEAIRSANFAIRQAAANDPSLAGMGTTVVVAAIRNNVVRLAYVGDSRAYWIGKRSVVQLSIDHTWIQAAIERGYKQPHERTVHPNRNVIMRSLGSSENIEVDTRIVPTGSVAGEPHSFLSSLAISSGDAVLLCTDGLSDLVTTDEIAHTIMHNDPGQAADALIRLANEKGGHDNITAVVIQRKSKSRRTAGIALMLALFILAGVAWNLLGARNKIIEEPIVQRPAAASAGVLPATQIPSQEEPDSVVVTSQSTLQPIHSPTPTVTTTPTPTAGATPTAAASATSTDGLFSGESPIITPVINHTPAAEISPVMTATEELTTAVSSIISESIPTGGSLHVDLISPDVGNTAGNESLFSWMPLEMLPADYYYNVVVFARLIDEPKAQEDCWNDEQLLQAARSVTDDGTIEDSLPVELPKVLKGIKEEFPADPIAQANGQYYWAVALYNRADNEIPVCILSELRAITVK
ncbi:MAG: serine/threonine-protein phosphatase [Caldilineaceae bacterium]|nr:serine/threonine-protein phosphatase [Caldilineaceae bacterium]